VEPYKRRAEAEVFDRGGKLLAVERALSVCVVLLEKGLKTASLLRCHIESPKEVFIHLNRAVAVVVD